MLRVQGVGWEVEQGRVGVAEEEGELCKYL